MRTPTSKAPRPTQAERTKRAAEAFEWLRLLNGDRDPMALAVGVELLEYFNRQNGEAWPGYGKIAETLGVAETTVLRAIHRMHKRGRLKVAWGSPGRGHPNRYWMVVKPAPAQVSEPGKPARRKPAPEENKTCASAREPLKRTTIGGKPKGFPPLERETAPAALEDPLLGGTALRAAPDIFLSKRAAGAAQSAAGSKQGEAGWQFVPGYKLPGCSETEQQPPSHRVVDIETERAFRELREIWDRGWPADDAPREIAIGRIAFAKACAAAEGGGEAIVSAAKIWVAAADAPRFLPPLAVWLDAQSWAKPPPIKQAKRERVGGRGERSRYDKPTPPHFVASLLAIAEREG